MNATASDKVSRESGGPANLGRLRDFVLAFSELVAETAHEVELLDRGKQLLAGLVSIDDWLPAQFAQSSASRYQQYLLHCDGAERFSVVSFVWGPGQATPIHDHRTWGIVGMLRGAETSERFIRTASGQLKSAGPACEFSPGEVDCVSPSVGDLHRVRNALADRTSVSIHVYGGNIGRIRRAIYEDDGSSRAFVSGYSSEISPNFWGDEAKA